MTVTIAAAQVVLAGLIVMMTLEFIALVALGDFCMDPTESVVSAIEEDTVIQESARYYSTCQGHSPLNSGLTNAYSARDQLGHAIHIELTDGVCPNDPNLMDSMRALSRMHSWFEWIAEDLDCDSVHGTWVMTFERALCKDAITGIFWVWISQYITLLALIVVSLSASVMMLYFDKYWDISATVEFKLDSAKRNATLSRYGTGEDEDDDEGVFLSPIQLHIFFAIT